MCMDMRFTDACLVFLILTEMWSRYLPSITHIKAYESTTTVNKRKSMGGA